MTRIITVARLVDSPVPTLLGFLGANPCDHGTACTTTLFEFSAAPPVHAGRQTVCYNEVKHTAFWHIPMRVRIIPSPKPDKFGRFNSNYVMVGFKWHSRQTYKLLHYDAVLSVGLS
jgi:hypothetical protein